MFRWYGPASAESVHKAVRAGLGYENAAVVYGDGKPVLLGGSEEPVAIDLLDESGSHVDLSQVRDGATLVARLRPSMKERVGLKEKKVVGWPILRTVLRDLRRSVREVPDEHVTGVATPDLDRPPARGDWNDPDFQQTLLGVERIRSHLANERNILAWTRAALTLASQGVTIWKLYADLTVASWLKSMLWCVAFAYFLIVPATIILGLERWRDTKEALMVKGGMDVQRYFGKLGVKLQAANMIVILIAAAITFIVVGNDDSLFRDFKPANIFDRRLAAPKAPL